MAPLSITASDSLNYAMYKTQGLEFGGTDCALPMLDALCWTPWRGKSRWMFS